ncbi:cis-L-3-hydroxyproline dehydratase [Purpureocillium lavendulum]|uniref:Cis-L-3-hydroxyproline dehydratase n=1 Tax=Purpureocillium lavendulum TaxID=1247861 RepID=A0AB34FJS0_9HYPO|nr:cis-L-3-hydroxyproline dehydratase [Purpureocillium lavendulum]
MAHSDVTGGPVYRGHAYVHGKASGTLIASNQELSFWGGVHSETGEIIDQHHPLKGKHLKDKILAIPGGRGSCSGSTVLLELLLNHRGPRAIIFQRREDILTLGVVVAEEIFNKAIPVVVLDSANFNAFLKMDGRTVHVHDGCVFSAEFSHITCHHPSDHDSSQRTSRAPKVELSAVDQAFLDGQHGRAAQAAMRILMRMADLLAAHELMDITQVHVDSCIYTGPASLAFAERLRDWGGKVRVPTSLNSISVDQRRWRAQRIDASYAGAASRLSDAFTNMGAKPTFTCAPYQLSTAPKLGDQVAWAESNAVVYANSVLGARTRKYPDLLDIAIALTGRAPAGGPHTETNRLASLIVRVTDLGDASDVDDSLYPLLGYHVGALAADHIPAVVGLQALSPSKDDLKAFGAAFATVSSAPMFHIVGVTPEAADLNKIVSHAPGLRTVKVGKAELAASWNELNSTSKGQPVGLISLGNPHFSFAEVRKLAQLCRGRNKSDGVAMIVTCGRSVYHLTKQAGLVDELERFGCEFVTDTCWCMITQDTILRTTDAIMTNSGKYAHYGPGLTGRPFYFGSLAGCVDVACQGGHGGVKPQWLADRVI